MNDKKNPVFLKHYTRIEFLRKILKTNKLRLSDPKKWEDKNDSAVMRAFCRSKDEGTIARVLCLAEGDEMIHNWNIYTKDEGCRIDGCYIEFDDKVLLKKFEDLGFLHDYVKYIPEKEIKSKYLNTLKPDEIPFLKRRPYECEKEYRVIWSGTSTKEQYISLTKNSIKRITLSPYIRDDKLEKLKSEFEKKYGVRINLSRLLKSPSWISKFDNYDSPD